MIGSLTHRLGVLSLATLSLGILMLVPSWWLTEAQSSKQPASGQSKHAMVDNGVDSLQRFSTSMELLSKRVSPSVVQIFSTGYNLDADREHNNTNLFSRRSSSGSGIIIATDGWIVTNAHVVEGSRRIRIRLNQENDVTGPPRGSSRHALLEARLVLADRDTDLAFLKVDATDLPALELSDSSELRQGQVVLAFGSPLGLDNSVSMGVVSSVARQLDPDSPTIYVQTDAAINPGNSGGPLVNTGGRVVGVNTMILTQSGGNEGIGLAIPSNVIRSVYNQVRKEGHVHHHGIGMAVRNITPALAAGLDLSQEDGVLIEDVTNFGPAECRIGQSSFDEYVSARFRATICKFGRSHEISLCGVFGTRDVARAVGEGARGIGSGFPGLRPGVDEKGALYRGGGTAVREDGEDGAQSRRTHCYDGWSFCGDERSAGRIYFY
jgi:S1-C subfamily serine protease